MSTEVIDVPEEEQKNVSEEQQDSPKQDSAEQKDDSVFEDKKHFPIFPTNLFEFEMKGEELLKMNNCLPTLLDLLNEEKPNWVTHPRLHTLDGFKDSVDVLKEAISEVLGFGGVQYDDLALTSLRASRYTQPEVSPLEVRPNNLLSGIFFLKADGGRITFFDPRPQAWIIKPPISQANLYNSDAFSIEFKENKLLIFPAWLQYQLAFKADMGENVFLTWTAMVKGGAKPTED